MSKAAVTTWLIPLTTNLKASSRALAARFAFKNCPERSPFLLVSFSLASSLSPSLIASLSFFQSFVTVLPSSPNFFVVSRDDLKRASCCFSSFGAFENSLLTACAKSLSLFASLAALSSSCETISPSLKTSSTCFFTGLSNDSFNFLSVS